MIRTELLPPPSRIRAGELSLAFDVAGASRRPLVLVHGYLGSRLDFVDVRAALARRRRVIAFDQRGHGLSDRRVPYTIARAMRDLEAFLDALGEPRVDLLGHSMGGMVALRLAVARPRRVRALILVSATAGPFRLDGVPEPELAPLRKAKLELKRALRRDFAAEMARSLRAEPAVRRRFEAIVRAGHRWADPVAAHQFAVDFGRLRSIEDQLVRFDGPTLVMVGAHDVPFVEPSRALAAGLSDARLLTLDHAGHFPQFETRRAWLEAIDDHL